MEPQDFFFYSVAIDLAALGLLVVGHFLLYGVQWVVTGYRLRQSEQVQLSSLFCTQVSVYQKAVTPQEKATIFQRLQRTWHALPRSTQRRLRSNGELFTLIQRIEHEKVDK